MVPFGAKAPVESATLDIRIVVVCRPSAKSVVGLATTVALLGIAVSVVPAAKPVVKLVNELLLALFPAMSSTPLTVRL